MNVSYMLNIRFLFVYLYVYLMVFLCFCLVILKFLYFVFMRFWMGKVVGVEGIRLSGVFCCKVKIKVDVLFFDFKSLLKFKFKYFDDFFS